MLRTFLLVAAVAGLAACDTAPHDNPFDPESDRFRPVGAVVGQVTGTGARLSEGRPGALVRLTPDQGGPARATVTDGGGFFSFTDLDGGLYRIAVEGDGFVPAAREVTVDETATNEVTLRLDALPVVTSATARTIHVESVFPEVERYALEVVATVSDPDVQPVPTAVLVIESLDVRVPLVATSLGTGESTFRGTVGASDLPGESLELLLGVLLRVEVTDNAGNVTTSAPFGVVRVIDPVPAPVSPVSGAFVVPDSVALVWDAGPLPFEHTLRVEVRTNRAFGPSVLLEAATLPSTARSYTVQRPLPADNYFWTVAYVDAAGNRSRSPEGTFEVQP